MKRNGKRSGNISKILLIPCKRVNSSSPLVNRLTGELVSLIWFPK